jgi:thiamine biosynthesis protein ThiS
MKIRVNGSDQEVPEGLTVDALLAHLGMANNRVAIERNLDILPRSAWQTTAVEINDSYEIVHFVGGG